MEQCSEPKHRPYDRPVRIFIQIAYIIAIVIWLIIIYVLHLYKCLDPFGLLILSIPLFVFAIGFQNVCKQGKEVEGEMFRADFLALGLLFVSILIEWKKEKTADRTTSWLILLAFIFIIFSVIDLWVTYKYLSLLKHIKSMFQTYAAVLLIYVLYLQFRGMTRHVVPSS